ncbi:hypothetical protein MW695_03890 [Alkalihalobacillus sp. APA_J-10(15)]|nr:hypothetical protein [Halalkalibacter sp. APA_J-10(15)]
MYSTDFALLRSEFREARRELAERDGVLRRIMIFFGGSDPTNETRKALKAVGLMNRIDILFDVIVGQSNVRKDQIKRLCKQYPNVVYYEHINHIANVMLKASLAIGAGGSTTWERCYLGLPTLTIMTAKNQENVIASAFKYGIIHHIGDSQKVTAEDIVKHVEHLLKHPDKVKEMSYSCMTMMGKEFPTSMVTQHIVGGVE